MVGQTPPDVVFMDVRMPGMGGIEATQAIREVDPDTKVILFTVDESRAAIADAIQARRLRLPAEGRQQRRADPRRPGWPWRARP